MNLIIAGGRDFNDYNLLCNEVNRFIGKEQNVTIISGLARGADKLGCRFAEENKYPLRGFAAEWGKFGRAAGPIRNKLMAKNADALLAFWDGKSRGTAHMIDYATEMGLKVKVVEYNISDKVLEKQVWDGIRKDNLI
jgi:predicted Rossmann fold nucleotide-binding protein DprA/Smf involved in DNA uptake